jgi:hypothetical protein
MAAPIEILELRRVSDCGSVRAFVKLRVGGFTIHGCRVIRQDGQRPWVARPQVPARKKADGSGGGWFPVLEATKELKRRIDDVVIEAWERPS